MFDIGVSTAGLLLLSPLFALITVAILAADGTPVLFRQERIGHRGKPFRMLKFRTMVRSADKLGRLLTVGRDARVTRSGYWLRKSKLDELPQLVNVLRGQMSLVGPRPEVPAFVALYAPEHRQVLDLVPGITDPASIVYRDESELLAGSPDPELTYVKTIMPDKIRINLEYAKHATLWSDIRVLIRTLMVIPGWPKPQA